MRLLLDTHAVLWYLVGDTRLSVTARGLIDDATNVKYVSPVVHWETAIKISLGKYTLHQPFDEFFQLGMQRTGFRDLPVEIKITNLVSTMPFHHRDPFDRLLVAQALAELMPVVSCDSVLGAYGIQRLW